MASAAADDNLECPVCHDYYSSPKILPCYHLACRDCILSWLKKRDTGDCPLCRVPILSPILPNKDHPTQVDALPTDLVVTSLVNAQQALTEPHVCTLCSSNTPATSYCFQCAVKLCANCSHGHNKLPACKDHTLQDVTALTVKDLSAHFQSSCQNHAGRLAEVYCSSHQELVCWQCAATSHCICPEVKGITVIAEGKRAELGQLVQRLKTKEVALARQIQSRKDKLSRQRQQVEDVFRELQQKVEKRRLVLYDAIRKEDDENADLEKVRATVKSHALTMERILRSPTDGIVLQMMDQLEPRSQAMEFECGRADDLKAVRDLCFDIQVLSRVKSDLSTLGDEVTVHTTTTPVTTSSRSGSPLTPPTATRASATTPTTSIATTPSSAASPLTTPIAMRASVTTLTTHTTPTTSAIPSAAECPLTAPIATGASVTTPTTPSTSTTSSRAVSPLITPMLTEILTTTPTTHTTPTTSTTSKDPTPHKPTGEALAKVLKVGDRVRVSRIGRPCFPISKAIQGTVTAVPSQRVESKGKDPQGWVDVKWDTRQSTYCCMGWENWYDLELL